MKNFANFSRDGLLARHAQGTSPRTCVRFFGLNDGKYLHPRKMIETISAVEQDIVSPLLVACSDGGNDHDVDEQDIGIARNVIRREDHGWMKADGMAKVKVENLPLPPLPRLTLSQRRSARTMARAAAKPNALISLTSVALRGAGDFRRETGGFAWVEVFRDLLTWL